MRPLPLILLLCGALVSLSLRGQAAPKSAGGRDLTVALFSTHRVVHATLTPLAADAWTATCSSCPHQPLHAPLTLAPPIHLLAGGTLRLTDTGSGVERSLTGLWRISTFHDALAITASVPSERYVEAVLNAESSPAEPPASLRALAIVARTFALNGRHYSAPAGALPADLCDSTACQAVRFGPVSSSIREAVRDTSGETLWFRGKAAEVFFSQHCGGISEDVGVAWPKLAGVPYLRSHPDPFCLRHGTAAWHADLPVQKILAPLTAEARHLSLPLTSVTISKRSSTGRALQIALTGADRRTVFLSAESFRLAVGRTLGWDLVRSDLYQVALHHDTLVFDGRGHGHGVGLCQTGAAELAREGKTARDILAFYFPGTAVRILPADTGWQQTRVGPLLVRTTQALPPDLQAQLRRGWGQATSLFPSQPPITPTLVFAPSAELFRQLTHQPGWNLASTTETTTVLQPSAVLAANQASLASLLLHEFLHIRVEAASTTVAPLWLREGLVEVLAEKAAANPAAAPAAMPAAQMPLSAVEHGLQQPATQHQAKAAHQAAALYVRPLLQRYGLAVLQGWLVDGVPSGIA